MMTEVEMASPRTSLSVLFLPLEALPAAVPFNTNVLPLRRTPNVR
jgi:hypothetical protein